MRELVCVDGDLLAGVGTEAEIISHLKGLLEIFNAFDLTDTEVILSRPYYKCAAGSFGRELYELLYTDWLEEGLDADLKKALRIALERARRAEVEDVNTILLPPHSNETRRKDGQYQALQYQVMNEGLPLGILLELFKGSGGGSFSTATATTACFFLSGPSDALALARYSFVSRGRNPVEFHDACERAFPLLYIHPDVVLNDIGLDIHSSFDVIYSHLVFLNDEYRAIGSECSWDIVRMMAVARAKGLPFSDESSNTKQDPKKMRERNVVFEAEGRQHIVCCSLHTKIQPTIGRIHFHPPTDFSGGRVLVGKFHPHLSV